MLINVHDNHQFVRKAVDREGLKGNVMRETVPAIEINIKGSFQRSVAV